VSLRDANTLLIGILWFLRTGTKADGKYSQKAKVSELHGAFSDQILIQRVPHAQRQSLLFANPPLSRCRAIPIEGRFFSSNPWAALAIASRPGLRLNVAMPELTHRRSADHRHECWHVYYGDIQAGTIAARAGTPRDTNPWEWSCGFHPGEQHNGTAATFVDARARFEQARRVLLSKRTEADFQEWREQRDLHQHKYAMWERGELLPSQKPNSMMRCPCGVTFDSHDPAASYVHRRHIYARQTSMKFADSVEGAKP
jgi:hypothetical protein